LSGLLKLFHVGSEAIPSATHVFCVLIAIPIVVEHLAQVADNYLERVFGNIGVSPNFASQLFFGKEMAGVLDES